MSNMNPVTLQKIDTLRENYLKDEKARVVRNALVKNDIGTISRNFDSERNNPNTETRFDFFDIEYNHLDILNGHPQADSVPSRPDNYDEMVECARRLSEGYAFLRVDLYTLNGKIYFGETTFFHHSGMVPFVPGKWDDIMGAWIKLPQKYNG